MEAHAFRSLFFLDLVEALGIDLQAAGHEACSVQVSHRLGSSGDRRYRIFGVTEMAQEWWSLPALNGGGALGSVARRVFGRYGVDMASVKVGVVVCPHAIAALAACSLWRPLPFLETAQAELCFNSMSVHSKHELRNAHVLPEYDAIFVDGDGRDGRTARRPREQSWAVSFMHGRQTAMDARKPEQSLSPAFLKRAALQMQEVAATVLEAHPGRAEVWRTCIEGLLEASWSLSAAGVQRDLFAETICKPKRGQGQYAAWVVLRTVLLCQNVRDANKLRETLVHAGSLSFPALSGQVAAIMADRSVPSASTIHRQRFLVDTAFMRYMREKHKRWYEASLPQHTWDHILGELINVGSFHYLMTDASPQAGQEWQMSQAMSIPLDRLREVGEAFSYLTAARQRSEADQTVTARGARGRDARPDAREEEALLRRQHHTTIVEEAVEEHMLPVAGLGRAAMGVRRKIHALLHQVKLELHTSKDLREYLAATVSITTDQGTESGLAELPALDLSQFQSVEESVEIEMDVCEDLGEDVCRGIEMELEGEVHVAGGPAQPGFLPVADAERPPRAGSGLPANFLWPFTLVVLGMCHISHNACETLCESLPCWDDLVGKLRPFAAFLHSRASRQRFADKCLDGGTAADASFKKHLEGNFHNLYTARWGSTTRVVEEILSVRPLLVNAWDTEKYLEGSSASEAVTAQLNAISDAVREPLFWALRHMVLHLQTAMSHFAGWCEGCPCHALPRADGRWRRQRGYMQDTGRDPDYGRGLLACPLKGARAPELACGDHREILQVYLDEMCVDLLRELPVMLNAQD